MANGLVAWFEPSDYIRMRELVNGNRTVLQARMLFVNPKNYRRCTKLATIKFENGSFKIDGISMQETSQKRLRMTPNWSTTLAHPWNIGCSIVELADGKFLITGGTNPPDTSWGGLPQQDAFIFDASTGKITGQFRMNGFHTGHSSYAISNDRVLVISGSGSASLELLDTRALRSITTSAQPLIADAGASCLVDPEHVLLVAGKRDSEQWPTADIIWLNLKDYSCEKIGQIKRRRYFVQEERNKLLPMDNMIEGVLEPLADNNFVVSGGYSIEPIWSADFATDEMRTAEIFKIVP